MSRTILLVEPAPGRAQALQVPLAAAGFSVHVCSEALEALEAFLRVQPDLVIIETAGHDDASGLCHVFKETQRGEVPVVVVIEPSGGGDEAVHGPSGADCLLHLPLAAGDLVAECSRLLDPRPAHVGSLADPAAANDAADDGVLLDETMLQDALDHFDSLIEEASPARSRASSPEPTPLGTGARGHGASSADPLHESLEELARIADELVDRLPERAPAPQAPDESEADIAERAESLQASLEELSRVEEPRVAAPAPPLQVGNDRGEDIDGTLDALFGPPSAEGPIAPPGPASRSAKPEPAHPASLHPATQPTPAPASQVAAPAVSRRPDADSPAGRLARMAEQALASLAGEFAEAPAPAEDRPPAPRPIPEPETWVAPRPIPEPVPEPEQRAVARPIPEPVREPAAEAPRPEPEPLDEPGVEASPASAPQPPARAQAAPSPAPAQPQREHDQVAEPRAAPSEAARSAGAEPPRVAPVSQVLPPVAAGTPSEAPLRVRRPRRGFRLAAGVILLVGAAAVAGLIAKDRGWLGRRAVVTAQAAPRPEIRSAPAGEAPIDLRGASEEAESLPEAAALGGAESPAEDTTAPAETTAPASPDAASRPGIPRQPQTTPAEGRSEAAGRTRPVLPPPAGLVELPPRGSASPSGTAPDRPPLTTAGRPSPDRAGASGPVTRTDPRPPAPPSAPTAEVAPPARPAGQVIRPGTTGSRSEAPRAASDPPQTPDARQVAVVPPSPTTSSAASQEPAPPAAAPPPAAAQTQPAPTDAARESSDERPPVVVERIEPVFPASVRNGPGGTVVLDVLVDERGKPVRVVVREGRPGSEEVIAAIDAVLRWSFEPGRQNGAPARTWLRESIPFGRR